MSSHIISRRFRSRMLVGVCKDTDLSFKVENEFKWELSDHVRMYTGLRYSIDGW